MSALSGGSRLEEFGFNFDNKLFLATSFNCDKQQKWNLTAYKLSV